MLFNVFSRKKDRSIPEPLDTWTDEEVTFVKECMEAKKSIDEIHQKLYEKFNSYHSADAINLKISDIERNILENSYQSTENVTENSMQPTDTTIESENVTDESENVTDDSESAQMQLDLGLENQPKLMYTLGDLALYVYSLSKEDIAEEVLVRLKGRVRRVIKSYKDVQTSKIRTSEYESAKRCYTFPSLSVLEQFATDVRTKFPCIDATPTLTDSIKNNEELFKGNKLFFSARDIMALVMQPKDGTSLSTKYEVEYYYVLNTLNHLNIKNSVMYDQVKYFSLTPSLVLEFVNKLKNKYANIASSTDLQIEDVIEYANNLAINNNSDKIIFNKTSDMYTKLDLANRAYNLDKKSTSELTSTYQSYMSVYFQMKNCPSVKINSRGLMAFKLDKQELEEVLTYIRETFNSNLEVKQKQTTEKSQESEVITESKTENMESNVETVESNVETVEPEQDEILQELVNARTSVTNTQAHRSIRPINTLLYNQAKLALSNLQTILATEDNISSVSVDMQKNSASVTFTWN